MADGIDLGKQVGPLPLGAWIAVVAAGLGIAYYTRNSGSASTATTDAGVVDNTGTPAGTADGSVSDWTATTPVVNTGQGQTFTDNDSWGNAAINFLIAQGYQPDWAYSAITKALAGGTGSNRLSVREYALWNAALRALGSPPTPLTIPPPGTPSGGGGNTGGGGHNRPTIVINRHEYVPNHPDNGKCKVCGHAKDNYFYHFRHQKNPAQPGANAYTYARVTAPPLPGSTLRSLALIYYKDGSKWDRIYEANRSGTTRADGTPGLISDPKKLHIGWKLIIPKGA